MASLQLRPNDERQEQSENHLTGVIRAGAFRKAKTKNLVISSAEYRRCTRSQRKPFTLEKYCLVVMGKA